MGPTTGRSRALKEFAESDDQLGFHAPAPEPEQKGQQAAALSSTAGPSGAVTNSGLDADEEFDYGLSAPKAASVDPSWECQQESLRPPPGQSLARPTHGQDGPKASDGEYHCAARAPAAAAESAVPTPELRQALAGLRDDKVGSERSDTESGIDLLARNTTAKPQVEARAAFPFLAKEEARIEDCVAVEPQDPVVRPGARAKALASFNSSDEEDAPALQASAGGEDLHSDDDEFDFDAAVGKAREDTSSNLTTNETDTPALETSVHGAAEGADDEFAFDGPVDKVEQVEGGHSELAPARQHAVGAAPAAVWAERPRCRRCPCGGHQISVCGCVL